MTLGSLRKPLCLSTGLLAVLLVTQTVVSAPALPNPVLYFSAPKLSSLGASS